MDASDWVAIGVGGAASVLSVIAIVQSKRANETGGISATAAKDSAAEARRAADAAERAAEAATEANRLEHEREHRLLRPEVPGVIEARLEGGREGTGMRHLMASITVNRDYRVTAEARSGNSTSPLAMPLVLRSGQPERFQVEAWPPDKTEPTAQEILFKFWPPIAGMDGADWSCPCDRPNGSGTGPGHWEIPVRVKFVPPPPKPIFFLR